MTIQDFEKNIQQNIDPNLTIVPHPTLTDISIVLWKGFNIGIVLPPLFIYDKTNPLYCDAVGFPYRTTYKARNDIRQKLLKVRQKMKDYET